MFVCNFIKNKKFKNYRPICILRGFCIDILFRISMGFCLQKRTLKNSELQNNLCFITFLQIPIVEVQSLRHTIFRNFRNYLFKMDRNTYVERGLCYLGGQNGNKI
jgi:hypothetical protein